MQIYIMRHGEASEQYVTSVSSDALRPLTNKGGLEATQMGQWLSNQQPTALTLFVSPYLRAQQTCENVITALKESGIDFIETTTTLDYITPAGNAQQCHDYIDGVVESNKQTSNDLLLVSHMPFVSYLVAQLTDTQNMPIFATGAIAQIDYNCQTMQGELIGIFSPENLPVGTI